MANQLQCESDHSSCTNNNNNYDTHDDAAVEMASPACYRGIIPNANGYADDGFDRFLKEKEDIAPSNTLQAEHEHDTPSFAASGSMTYSASSEQDSCGTLSRDGMDAVDMDDDDDDGFGDFETFTSPSSSTIEQNDVVFSTMDEALDQWKTLLAKVFPGSPSPKVDEDWVGNDMTSIRRYVLEEAHESIHSRITWTAVTHAMDDDTGVPKVRWNHSKIEDMYLSALNCKRQKDPVPLVPSTLSITGEPDRDDIPSTPPPMTAPSTFPDTQQSKQPTTPSSSRRSSFGFSFARFLPRLSTSSLPRSDSSAPTSASSPTTNKRFSLSSHPARISNDIIGRTSPTPSSPPPPPEIASNSNPLSKPTIMHNIHHSSTTMKRHSMPITTTRTTTMKINTSLANQNLLDLDDDDGVTISSPPAARSLFSFTPLTPTAVYHSTPPATTQSSIPENKQQQNLEEDDFGDFEQATMENDNKAGSATTTTTHVQQSDTTKEDDDFGDFMQSHDTKDDDDDWGEWSSA